MQQQPKRRDTLSALSDLIAATLKGQPMAMGQSALRSLLYPNRTLLTPGQEAVFQRWYREQAAMAGLDPNPDSAGHKYDYRGAFLANVTPQINREDGLYHWPSTYKDDDHPNRFVRGVDTRALDRGR